jgi:hypothetical protein
VSAIGAGTLDPLAQRGLGQVQVAGVAAPALALVRHEPYGLRVELLIAGAAGARACLPSVWTSPSAFRNMSTKFSKRRLGEVVVRKRFEERCAHPG